MPYSKLVEYLESCSTGGIVAPDELRLAYQGKADALIEANIHLRWDVDNATGKEQGWFLCSPRHLNLCHTPTDQMTPVVLGWGIFFDLKSSTWKQAPLQAWESLPWLIPMGYICRNRDHWGVPKVLGFQYRPAGHASIDRAFADVLGVPLLA